MLARIGSGQHDDVHARAAALGKVWSHFPKHSLGELQSQLSIAVVITYMLVAVSSVSMYCSPCQGASLSAGPLPPRFSRSRA